MECSMETRRFLITGGSQGIGEALVERARTTGHQVVFTGRDAARIAAVEKATGARGIVADVAKPDDNARTVELCRTQMGGVDVLINNAGYAYRGEIGAIDLEAMRDMFDVNVFGLV